jgi:hypothetical protein
MSLVEIAPPRSRRSVVLKKKNVHEQVRLDRSYGDCGISSGGGRAYR